MEKNIPARHNPLYNKENILDFGDELDLTIMTDEQKTDAFLSKYMDKVDPLITYKKYFDSSAKSTEHILKEVKIYYKKLVLLSNWSERKYVTVINDIFENRLTINVVTLDRSGLLYDKEQLASQRRIKKTNRRRKA